MPGAVCPKCRHRCGVHPSRAFALELATVAAAGAAAVASRAGGAGQLVDAWLELAASLVTSPRAPTQAVRAVFRVSSRLELVAGELADVAQRELKRRRVRFVDGQPLPCDVELPFEQPAEPLP